MALIGQKPLLKGRPIPGRKETFGPVANVNLEGVYLSFPETRFGRGKVEVVFKALGSLGEGGPTETGKSIKMEMWHFQESEATPKFTKFLS